MLPTFFAGGQPADETYPAKQIHASRWSIEQFLSDQRSGTMTLLGNEVGFLYSNILGRDAAFRTQ